MSRAKPIAVVALLFLAAACSGGGSGGGGGFVPAPAVDLQPAFGGRAFANPVKLVQHPTDDTRWYVVEQGGLVKTFVDTGSAPATVAADVDALENLGIANEQGLLGMAFDPDFDATGEVYFTYTDDAAGDVVLARWESSDDGLTFTPAEVVLRIDHPRNNHNGGDIVFGADGFLYYSMGDGGSSNDPDDNGQNENAVLGKILRLDVTSTPPVGEDYAVPVDNPAVGNAHCDGDPPFAAPCPEVFALGFRNPWRMNFDPATGILYVGDVGEGMQEEIDIVALGENYGWDCVEGEVGHATSAPCNFADFTAPEAVHGRSEAQAITGGAVYRGAAIPALQGFYVYGDFVTQRFFTFDTEVADALVQNLALPATSVSAFGQGRDGEIYVVGFGTPSIQKIVPGSG